MHGQIRAFSQRQALGRVIDAFDFAAQALPDGPDALAFLSEDRPPGRGLAGEVDGGDAQAQFEPPEAAAQEVGVDLLGLRGWPR